RYGGPLPLLSFPTRRSSALHVAIELGRLVLEGRQERCGGRHEGDQDTGEEEDGVPDAEPVAKGENRQQCQDHEGERAATVVAVRSEEHTSELQSRENLVCRL